MQLYNRTIEAGGDITTLLRAYRVGHQATWTIWSEHVASRVNDARLLYEILAYSSTHMFAYLDRACERLVAIDRARGRDSDTHGSRAELVARLLSPDQMAVDAASASLGYELRAHHIGIVATPLGADGNPRRAIDALVHAAGGRPLLLPGGDGAWWAWIGWPTEPEPQILERLLATETPAAIAGLGEPARGREGFRRTHLQAAEAQRTARLAKRPHAGVVRHRDVELAAVLCADPERARRLARERLGPLAAQDDAAAKLRQTVRAFLATGSVSAAAEQLDVHQKTISYRLRQVQDLLGRPVTEDRAELEAALVIEETLDLAP